jgi:hypothetical protein
METTVSIVQLCDKLVGMKLPLLPLALAPPLAVKPTLLLTEFCLVETPDLQHGLVATQTAVAHKKLPARTGWHHDGINE